MEVPQLIVLKDAQVIDNVLLHGKDSFVLGRNQDCDIVAGHASISRHHLEIRVLRGTRELLLTDIHSVHGTRLNGKTMRPLDSVVMNEDDTFEVGASTRTYMVKWIPVEQDESGSSSSCTPAKSASSSVVKGLDEEFESSLKLDNDKENFANSGDRENKTDHKRYGTSKNSMPKQQLETDKRLAFSEVNGRSSRGFSNASSPARKAASPSPLSTTKNQISSTALRMSPAGKKIFGVQRPEQSPSKLWLRRGAHLELPSLITNAEPPSAPLLPALDETGGEESYFSDKENMAPPKPETGFPRSHAAAKPEAEVPIPTRQPFQPLFFLPSPSAQREYKAVFEPAPYSTTSSDDESLKDYCRQPFRVREILQTRVLKPISWQRLDMQRADKFEEKKKHHQWHIIVDTNCLIDDDNFRALKQLEGLRETRVVIPKIVVRELDFLKKKEDMKYQSRRSLRWIEDCMVEKPWWIHVQNNSDLLPLGVTPPPLSPSLARSFFPYGVDLLSPTNDDHILECALLFEKTVTDGRVALLTNDTALKIKAMAEGLVAENAREFCASVLNPYSKRFLWGGSTVVSPLGRSNLSASASACGKNKAVDNHPRGLQVVL